MKQYTITKGVYANSVAEAIARESEGFVLGAGLADEFNIDDWKVHVEKRREVTKVLGEK